MERIDFNNVEPDFDNGEFKWYIDKFLNHYINNEQSKNLPKLENYMCFVVKNDEITDYVLIDNNQNVVKSYHYNLEGCDQMIAFINIIKISKNYDEHEKVNI